ncbi:MAG: hypothetical protein OXR73_07205 [Myxococcales bacterium]|nr:hypothetical protein [Myxococcales bacterium]
MKSRRLFVLAAVVGLSLVSACGMRSTPSSEDGRLEAALDEGRRDSRGADSQGDGDEADEGGDGDGDMATNTSPCGDGEPPCDPTNLNNATCSSVGAGQGILACDPVTCRYDTSMCQSGGLPMGGSGGVLPPPSDDSEGEGGEGPD